jgi:hypothetical protein
MVSPYILGPGLPSTLWLRSSRSVGFYTNTMQVERGPRTIAMDNVILEKPCMQLPGKVEHCQQQRQKIVPKLAHMVLKRFVAKELILKI